MILTFTTAGGVTGLRCLAAVAGGDGRDGGWGRMGVPGETALQWWIEWVIPCDNPYSRSPAQAVFRHWQHIKRPERVEEGLVSLYVDFGLPGKLKVAGTFYGCKVVVFFGWGFPLDTPSKVKSYRYVSKGHHWGGQNALIPQESSIFDGPGHGHLRWTTGRQTSPAHPKDLS